MLGPGRVTTLASRCEQFAVAGTGCVRQKARRKGVFYLLLHVSMRRLGDYRNVLSSVFVRYCRLLGNTPLRHLCPGLSKSCRFLPGRDPQDGGLCFEAQVPLGLPLIIVWTHATDSTWKETEADKCGWNSPINLGEAALGSISKRVCDPCHRTAGIRFWCRTEAGAGFCFCAVLVWVTCEDTVLVQPFGGARFRSHG